MAAAVPARPKHNASWFVSRTRKLVSLFERKEQQKTRPGTILAHNDQHDIVENIHRVAAKASTPLQRWEHSLQTPVAIFVLPIFALANADLMINGESLLAHLSTPVALGVISGLVVGKLTGITLMTWLTLRSGFGRLPSTLTMRHIFGIGLLAGMGFTMSIFIANLGFANNAAILLNAKISVLVASLISGITGYLWLRLVSADSPDNIH